MSDFWDYNVWGLVTLAAALLLALLAANGLKRSIGFLRASLIPTSVLAGLLLLFLSTALRPVLGVSLFDTRFFGESGMTRLENITYHMLALGFIASSFRASGNAFSPRRRREIFNTGVTTVSTYLLQGILGLGITLAASVTIMKTLFPAAGILLPFGYGQGTGQALNYGSIYESTYGFSGGRSFGLTIAAFGFLSASIGGIFYLYILKKGGHKPRSEEYAEIFQPHEIQKSEEIPMNGAIDKLTVQLGLVLGAYFVDYLIMLGLGSVLPGMRAVIYGFNFLFGVVAAVVIKAVLNALQKGKVVKRQYTNDFLMTRISNCCFDLMIVAGIAAIRIELLKDYWGIMILLGAVGLISTFIYNRFVAKKLFGKYETEQFLVMFGMLTGTASTGIMLLREVDGKFETPAADNLVYQNIPAIVFGFPMMMLATLAPKQPLLTLLILIAFFAVMNVILFRSFIFRRVRGKKPSDTEG